VPLSDGSSLHVTVAQWLTPNGRQISGQGLMPDVVVAMTGDDVNAGRDPQLARAIAAFP
jgi:carboxyl-terminal processing protease